MNINNGVALRYAAACVHGAALGPPTQPDDMQMALITVLLSSDQALNNGQAGALASLCAEIGPTAFRGSALLADLNRGDFRGAAERFVDHDGDADRRERERAMFLHMMPSKGMP